ncbi:nuclear mRNA splicing, via spliceosome-related protein [Filobasidium floriforme]|uniref:nuclear mRNA splicing, via spliceosome-related protein n=1 Tax=Filobasidium floriforme TaxID=5210 RepID=UPI001E8CF24A|nr:nuclear mRNA splicing, via spliceosome-related protein [Filobasidium floriforme]KAH8079854.1 nuclear mRNA splicing, via spliceosome-related protein [Filobasidium floriforme]
MQGFNKYYPPDYDSRETSTLNSYRGVHALGVRAKHIDKGILVVRFELPFNIWCGHCNSHLGAGVRYNAQKRKVGEYYSTAIYAFRCKCHLCSGWFEIRTDPKNARYVVEEGARAQEQDWDPEENGGYRAHDTEGPSAAEPPADAFQALEKSTTQATQAQSKSDRIEALAKLSYRQTSDPYTMSQHLRQRLREEKRVERDRLRVDEDVKSKYGLGLGLEGKGLVRLEPGEADEEYERARARRSTLAASSAVVSSGKRVGDLSTTLRRNTVERYNPFDLAPASASASASASSEINRVGRGKAAIIKISGSKVVPKSTTKTKTNPTSSITALGGLAGYGSDEDEEEDNP